MDQIGFLDIKMKILNFVFIVVACYAARLSNRTVFSIIWLKIQISKQSLWFV